MRLARIIGKKNWQEAASSCTVSAYMNDMVQIVSPRQLPVVAAISM
jgi:hypothetical protein